MHTVQEIRLRIFVLVLPAHKHQYLKQLLTVVAGETHGREGGTSSAPCFQIRSPGIPRGSWLTAMSSSDKRTPSASFVICLYGTTFQYQDEKEYCDAHQIVVEATRFPIPLLHVIRRTLLMIVERCRFAGQHNHHCAYIGLLVYLRSVEMNRGDFAMAHKAKWDLISSMVSSSLNGSPICSKKKI